MKTSSIINARLVALWVIVHVPALGAAAAAGDTRLAEAAMKRDAAAVRALLEQKVDVNAPGRDGTPALHWLVRVDDLESARMLIRAGADVARADRYGVTPLSLACSNGNADLIRLLLDAGANPNSADPVGETSLMTAARVGELDAVRLLLDRGAVVDAKDPEFEQTALMIAVRENHSEVVRLLVDRHADVNAKTRTGRTPPWVLPNSVPGFGHGVGIVRGGLPDRGSRYLIPGSLSPLLYAARDGRLASARILVAAGASLEQADANGITPLLMAIANNHIELARFLIDRGANVNTIDWYGRTPLWAAVETRNMDVDNATFENGVDRAPVLELIQVLLDRGVDPNSRTKETPPIRRQMLRVTGSLSWVDFTGQTPFLLASLSGDVTVMRLLLEYGADPNISTFGGTTALMAAAGVNWVVDQTFDEGPKGLLEAVKLCWELGMDVNAVNSMGLAAVHGAANRGSDDILQFLVDKGARLDVKDKEGRTPLTWAEGVFLATHPAKPKPSSIALIQKLTAHPAAAER
ncbi:MAG TPA: ankyrin repeat domain-containing protein [Vicinamibacterales bacterium]|nr:ankyrin repeat domain-containing protein [Vicinamibacterales bacterium]